MGFSIGKLIGGAVKLATRGPTGIALSLGEKALRAGLKKGLRRPGDRGLARAGQRMFAPLPAGTPAAQAPMPGGCPTGFRLNRSTYVTRGGGTSRWPQQLVVHPKMTECVRRRKVNAGNGKAATRAVRRLVAFYRLSNRVAKQLRRAASGAKIGRARGRKLLPAGSGSVQVIDTD